MTKTIHYLSTYPGAGKTTYAIEEILADRTSIHFYVSPTHKLADQTVENLKTAGIPENLIIKIGEEGSQLAHGTSKEIIYQLEGQETVSSSWKPASLGSVFVMTHQAFIQLPVLNRSSEVRVFFDEARKFVLQDGNLGFDSPEDKVTFTSDVIKYSKPLVDKEGEDSGFHLVSLPDHAPSPKSMAKPLNKSDRARLQYKYICAFWKNARNPGMDVYIYNTGLHDARRRKLSTGIDGVSIHKIVVPSRVFDQFKTVLLMSAYFEDSQMFHLLSADKKIDLINLRSTDPDLDEWFLDREALIEKRFADVTIFPLMDDLEKLSSYKLDHNLVVPRNSHAEILEDCSKAGLTPSVLSSLRRTLATSPRAKPHKRFQDIFDKINELGGSRSLITWYLEASLKVVSVIKGKGLLSEDPLLVVNNKFVDRVKAEAIPFIGEGRFTKIPSMSHGSNEFLKSNTIAYLSANNPTPEICRLFGILIPKYQPDLDHAADSCVQAVTRVSVRVARPLAGAQRRVFVILPDLGLTKLAHDKFKKKSTINRTFMDKFDMVSLNAALAKTAQKSGGKQGDKLGKSKGGRVGGKLGDREKKAEGGRIGGRMKAGKTMYKSPERLKMDKQLASIAVMMSKLVAAANRGEDNADKINHLATKRYILKDQIKDQKEIDQKNNPNK